MLFCTLFIAANSAFASFNLKGSIYETVANEVGLDPLLLYSVSMTESGFSPENSHYKQPWPWTICSADGSFFAATKKDAENEVRRLKSLGFKSVDVGLMQVNLLWHGTKLKQDDLFDPLHNLRVGARILKKALDSADGDLVTGIGRYHNWSSGYRQARYALQVLRTYKSLSQKIGGQK